MFGKYNEKTYKKNTTTYKSKLMNFMETYYSRISPKASTLMNAAIQKLDFAKLPSGVDWKVMDSIDKRIDASFNQLLTDIQRNETSRLESDVELLLQAIDARSFGKEKEQADVLEIERIAANNEALLNDLLIAQAQEVQEMKKLQEKARGLEKGSVQHRQLSLAFLKHQKKKESLDKQIQRIQAVYMSNQDDIMAVEIQKTMKSDGAKTVQTAAERAKRTADIQREDERLLMDLADSSENAQELNQNSSEFDAFGKAGLDALDNAMDLYNMDALSSDIDAADVGTTDAFDAFVNKKKQV